MFKNYITVAIRHLARHRSFSVIMVGCLAIGITFSLIIGLYVQRQERVNGTIRDVGNQYMIKSKWKVKGLGMDITTIAPLAKTMKEEYPDLVAGYYRYNPVGTVVSAGDNYFKDTIAICDTTLETVYGFPLLYGDKTNAFPTISSAVITEGIAMKWFGTKKVIGRGFGMQTTGAGDFQRYTISAVLKDIPENSVTSLSLLGTHYDVFVPTIGSRFYEGGDPSTSWNGASEIGMLELKPGVKPADLAAPFRRVLAKYTKDPFTNNLEVELAPLRDYYLKENNGAVQRMVITLSLVAVFILLMAIINFVNITIGTSAHRLKEIGLRKVFGGVQKQLVFQFIIEAWVLTLLAAVISLGLYQLLIPVFDQVLNTRLVSVAGLSFGDIGLLLSGVVAVGFLAGIYPAFILSRYAVINSVKGKLAKGGLGLRKTLLVVQLSLAICVFISTLNVSKQVSYVFSTDLGYDREQLLVVDAYPKQWDSAGVARMDGIKNGLLRLPAVKAASVSFEVPDRTPPMMFDLMSLPSAGNRRLPVEMIIADEDFANTFGLKLLEGSFFSRAVSYMPGQVVVNESAVKALGLSSGKATGAIVQLPDHRGQVTVTGVVKDFHYSGLQQAIAPLVFLHVRETKGYRYLTLKLQSADLSQAVSQVQTRWKELSPHAPFEFSFMDDRFEAMYRSDLQLKKAAGIATGLNLLIVFLGIFGIVAFTLTRRNKEMALRKVLGAGLVDIIRLFLRDYAGAILLANLISWPLAYVVTNKWLENYAYRITQDIVPYVVVGAAIFIVAFVLISAQCLKTAMANPVRSLRAE